MNENEITPTTEQPVHVSVRPPKWKRILVGIGLPLLCLVGVVTLILSGSPFFCPFHALTHLYCPGCGSGRAATAIVHLDFLTACRQNILFVIFVWPCAYYCFKLYVRYVFGRDLIPWRDPPNWVYQTISVIFILFWIFRNIPVFPFTLLAPI